MPVVPQSEIRVKFLARNFKETDEKRGEILVKFSVDFCPSISREICCNKFHTHSSTHQDLKFHTAEPKFFHSVTLGVAGPKRRLPRRVLEAAFEKLLKRVLRRCPAVGLEGGRVLRRALRRDFREGTYEGRNTPFKEYNPLCVCPMERVFARGFTQPIANKLLHLKQQKKRNSSSTIVSYCVG